MKMINVDSIPQKEALVQRLQGEVYEGRIGVGIGDVALTGPLYHKFLRRCKGFDSLQEAVDTKTIVVRGREIDEAINWFGLVSGEFQEYRGEDVKSALAQVGDVVEVRYNPIKESFQVGYQVADTNGAKVMLYVDSGDFGVYGGNGESAVKLGVSVRDESFSAWTLFQNKKEEGKRARTIHRFCERDLDKVVSDQLQFALEVEEKWEESKVTLYSHCDVEAFAFRYLKRCSDVFSAVMDGMNGSMSGYELVQMMQTQAVKLQGNAQLGLESLAGQVVMNPSIVSYEQGEQMRLL